MKQKPRNTFKSRQEQFNKFHDRYKRKYNRLSWARVLLFVLFSILIIILLSREATGSAAMASLIFLSLFLALVKWHQRTDALKNNYFMLSVINREEIQRLDHQYSHLDQGIEFINEEHPYSIDLDIFGSNSLFQLLNRTETAWGRNTLSRWLLSKADKKEVAERQSAVLQLQKEIDFRQELQASGRLSKGKESGLEPFLAWLHAPVRYLNVLHFRITARVLPLFSITLILLNIFGVVPAMYLFLPIIWSSIISANMLRYTNEMHQQTSQAVNKLQAYYKMIVLIEQSTFKDPRLKQLQFTLTGVGQVASERIRILRQILEQFNNRANMLYWIFNGFFMTDLIVVLSAEKWKERSCQVAESWFEAVAEYESLASFAAFSFAHPTCIMPTISDKHYSMTGKKIGHPLIPDSERVCNDFSLEGRGNIAIITGSNMAGKSTFLRTIGINTVLAFTGAPVCADMFEVSDFRVFTSMRTKDNLEEHVSSFYAELIRIKGLIETIDDNTTTVFFLLDEILKGTNSKDRHRGSEALLKQLSTTNALGMVSTHDLALGRMADKSDGIKNFSFNSSLKDNKLEFDYLLKQGICESFNASLLMAGIGIKIDPDQH